MEMIRSQDAVSTAPESSCSLWLAVSRCRGKQVQGRATDANMHSPHSLTHTQGTDFKEEP